MLQAHVRRDICVFLEGGGLRRINELNPAYDPLRYVLLFPRGEPGWSLGIPIQGRRVLLPDHNPDMDNVHDPEHHYDDDAENDWLLGLHRWWGDDDPDPRDAWQGYSPSYMRGGGGSQDGLDEAQPHISPDSVMMVDRLDDSTLKPKALCTELSAEMKEPMDPESDEPPTSTGQPLIVDEPDDNNNHYPPFQHSMVSGSTLRGTSILFAQP